MAGGSGGGNSRELDQTPTWAVAAVCAVIIIISLLLEKGLHHMGEWLSEKHKKALYEALEKIKAELMILGFISLLLSFGQNQITKICIPTKVSDTMLPCPLRSKELASGKGAGHRRRLLWAALMNQDATRRILAAGSTFECAEGKDPLISTNGLHQLHIFIFFLAVIHVANSGLMMGLGRAKIRGWKEWEKETASLHYEFSNDPSRFRFAHETSFVKQHASFWNRITILFYIVSFFRQFFRSVRKTDYLTMRHGFISAHLAPGSKFNFQKYIKRALEDDFKVVVGISPILWASAVIILLLNVHGWNELFWASVVPLATILAVGTKLQAIISRMALQIQERHAVVQGIPLVKLSDHHFWFGRPQFVLFLIHFSLFQNAFQLTYFFWIWYEFGLKSCFHENFDFVIARIAIGGKGPVERHMTTFCIFAVNVGIQMLCSYVTLPLYALVSQMGSQMKTSIFDEQTSKALKKWHQAVKKKHKKGSSHSPNKTPSASPSASPFSTPGQTPVHHMYRYKTIGHTGEVFKHSTRPHLSDHGNSDSEAEMNPVINSYDHESQSPEHLLDMHNQEDFSFAKLAVQTTQKSQKSQL